jgi:hypothetical protein
LIFRGKSLNNIENTCFFLFLGAHGGPWEPVTACTFLEAIFFYRKTVAFCNFFLACWAWAWAGLRHGLGSPHAGLTALGSPRRAHRAPGSPRRAHRAGLTAPASPRARLIAPGSPRGGLTARRGHTTPRSPRAGLSAPGSPSRAHRAPGSPRRAHRPPGSPLQAHRPRLQAPRSRLMLLVSVLTIYGHSIFSPSPK